MGRKNKKGSKSCNIVTSVEEETTPKLLPFLEISLNPFLSLIVNPFSKLIIKLTPDDDVPHPRHLCFRYPFDRTSHKRKHCKKCFCGVCDNIARCQQWTRHRHCDAIVQYEQPRMEILKWKYLNMDPPPKPMGRYKLNINIMLGDSEPLMIGYAGGIIEDEDGSWLIGFSMKLRHDDPSGHIHILNAIYEGLELAWAKGFIKFLEIKLGIAFEPNFLSFYFESNYDYQNMKPRFSLLPRSVLHWSESPDYNDDLYALLEGIEDYLNRDWLIINIKVACLVEELEAAPYALILKSCDQVFEMQAFEFPSAPLSKGLKVFASRIKKMLDWWSTTDTQVEASDQALDIVGGIDETMDMIGALTPPVFFWLLPHVDAVVRTCNRCITLNYSCGCCGHPLLK